MTRKTKTRLQTFAIYAVLVLLAVITVFPLLWAISASLRSTSEMFANMRPFNFHTIIPEKVTVDAYIDLFTEYNFQQPIKSTLIVVVVSIFFGVILNSIAAFAFAMFDFKFKNILFSLVLVSFMVPFEAIALPLYQTVDSMNLVDTYAGMILPGIADGLIMFLFVQFFKDIPADLLDAARVDGAGLGRIFRSILMPLSKPVFITAGLMIFMNTWNSYMWPLLVARSKDIRTIQIALTTFSTEHTTNWSATYAGSMVAALVPLAVFLPLQKYFVQGITSSGVKG